MFVDPSHLISQDHNFDLKETQRPSMLLVSVRTNLFRIE